jgi:signal peptidase I
MPPTAAADPRFSPWLSVWLSPRRTVDWLVANNPRQQVLLIAAIAGISDIAVRAIDLLGPTRTLVDWRVVAAIVVLGAAAGIISLYLSACFLKWSGRLVGGHASMVAIRAALAWGAVPLAVSAPICLAIFAGLEAGAAVPVAWAVVALKVIVAIPGLWGLVLVLLMFARIQGFG